MCQRKMKPDGKKEGAKEERTLDIHYFGTKVAKLILDLLFLHHCLVYFELSVRCTFMCSKPLACTGKKLGFGIHHIGHHHGHHIDVIY